MKKYNKEELGYFGLSEQELNSGEDYEQKLDEQEFGLKYDEKIPSPNLGNNYSKKQKKNVNVEEEVTVESIEDINATRKPKGITDLNFDDIESDDKLQTNSDLWSNGILIPVNTIFTVVTKPKKIKKIKNDDSDKIGIEYEYLVHGKALLDTTGQVIDIRINMLNCKRADEKLIKSMEEELKW